MTRNHVGKRTGLQQRIGYYLATGGGRIGLVLLCLLLGGGFLIYVSYSATASAAEDQAAWITDFTLNLGTGLFGSIPTYILFELVINRQQKKEDEKSRGNERKRERLLSEFRKAVSLEEKQKIINILREDELLRGLDVDLQDCDLQQLDLCDTDFSAANLRNANLQGCKIQRANFHRTQLSGADFTGADLSGSNFQGASMRHTNLQQTALIGASFIKAFLGEAQFQGANLSSARFKNATLHDQEGGVQKPVFDTSTKLPDYREWRPSIDFAEYTR